MVLEANWDQERILYTGVFETVMLHNIPQLWWMVLNLTIIIISASSCGLKDTKPRMLRTKKR